jgi:geranylgeranyl reductase
MINDTLYDAIVVGGGPAGATAANDLAQAGRTVALLDRAGRIKPCGGAIPPRAIADFAIPDHQLVTKVSCARMVSPKDREVDMPIDGGFVGMVDREHFDEWLRERAAHSGAIRVTGLFDRVSYQSDGTVQVHYRPVNEGGRTAPGLVLRAKTVIGADGAASGVARQCIPDAERTRYVAAYHEIIKSPDPERAGKFSGNRCDVWYQGDVSPDFYGWVFPHGETTSVGVGSALKGFSLRSATAVLRQRAGLEGLTTIRREGAPIPMKPLRTWDDGRNVVLAGDAAGVVAPASGEGIYYAMAGGRIAANAVMESLVERDPRALALARKRFLSEHGRVFWILGMMQWFWYSNDKRRERFVEMCRDPDVQRLTWQAYMHKRLVRHDPMAHLRIFMKDTLHLLGLARV